MRRTTLALSCLVAAACTSPTLFEQRPFDLARTRWESSGPTDYTVEMRIVCFCDPLLADWSRVTVVGGTITEVRGVESGELVPTVSWHAWPTVDGLFDRMAESSPSEVYARIDAEYDPELGYPREVQFIEREGVADAGISYQLRTLESISGPPDQ